MSSCNGAASNSLVTNVRVTWSSARSRRPAPARSRNSSSASWRKRSDVYAGSMPAQRFQPSRERIAEKSLSFVDAIHVAVEGRPPFHERSAVVDHRRHTQGRLKIPGMQRRFTDKFIGLRAFRVGQRDEPLTPARAPVEHIAYRPNRLAGFSCLDFAFSRAVDPQRIVI